jgi:hypothetical protein
VNRGSPVVFALSPVRGNGKLRITPVCFNLRARLTSRHLQGLGLTSIQSRNGDSENLATTGSAEDDPNRKFLCGNRS